MKGDLSRDTFDATRHFSRVLMQQGRVQLDADWNEQASILLHYLQTLAADLIGPFGGPADSFTITPPKDLGADFVIGKGHYYVDGILCENESDIQYTKQPGYPFPDSLNLKVPPAGGGPLLVYLDVWERHITALENDRIREVALGGPDTCTRAQVVWQVKIWPSDKGIPKDQPRPLDCPNVKQFWPDWVKLFQPENRGRLGAGTPTGAVDLSQPCITPPEARYRGAENQLYRVEVHRSGLALDDKVNSRASAATFKWSRDNGSVVYPILTLSGKLATVSNLGYDDRLTLEPDDWVEIADDDHALSGQAGPMAQVQQVDSARMTVIFKDNPVPTTSNQIPTYEANSTKHPLLRRWDQRAGDPKEGGLELSDGAALIKEDSTNLLLLEDGVQIQFTPNAADKPQYRSGDYWLIPARTATGTVEWPNEIDATGNPVPIARPPHGVLHHYAPLAIVNFTGGKITLDPAYDCHCVFDRLACPPPKKE